MAGSAIGGDPDQARGLQQRPGDEERALAEPVDELAGDRRDEEQRGGPRQQPQPGAERAVAEPRLQELRHEEHRAEQQPTAQKIAALPAENAREPKNRIGSIGFVVRSSKTTKATDERHAAEQRREHLRAGPAGGVGAHERPHDAEHAGADEREAGEVERGVRAAARGDAREDERDQREPDRDVEPEDPLPRHALGDRSTDQRPAGDGEAVDREEDPERGTAALGREGSGDEGERERGDGRRSSALHRPRDDQRTDARRQRAGGGSGREEGDPADEQPPPAEAVARARPRS